MAGQEQGQEPGQGREKARPPLNEQYMARLKGHQAVAILIVLGTIVTALASFTDAAGKLAAAFHRQRPEEARQELVRLSVAFTPDDFSAAAGRGDLTLTKLFLAAGMPVDAVPTRAAPTALVAAVRADKPEVVTQLLKAGADPTLHAGGFRSPLELAAVQGNARIATALLDGRQVASGPLAAAFLQAAGAGQPAMLALLKGRGADAGRVATAALQDAAAATRVDERAMADTVVFLLQAGADIEARSGESDWTPLHFACFDSQPAVVRALLEHGAAQDARDRDGRTPLWWAAGIGHLESATLLLSKGADANARDKAGMTVLGRARFNGDERMVRLLRAHGAT